MNAEQRILAMLERADFDGTGCRWSQDTLAAACMCSRRTVIRATQNLAREGRISIGKERRPGCKWLCNVYRVKHWNPHKRSGVLNLLAAIRESNQAQCHTERTATASKGSDPVGRALSPRCFAVGSTSAVVARRENGLRRLCMDQAKRRHLHVADLTCLHCAEKDAELERKNDIIRMLQVQLNESMEAEHGALAAAKAAGNALNAAKGQITRQARAEAQAKDIEKLLEFWRESHPRAQTPPGGKRWEVCKKALILMAEDADGPVLACLQALEGIRLFPWMLRGQRLAGFREGARRYDDVEHALGDEVRISKARGLAHWANADLAGRAWRMYQEAQLTVDYWQELVLVGLGERRRRSVWEMAEKAMEGDDGQD